jgi:hypothetical protein
LCGGENGINKGNLSSYLSKLNETRLIEKQKGIIGKIANTNVHLTKAGLTPINEHWKTLKALRNAKPGDPAK